MKTYQPKKGEIKRSWYLFDAKGQVLGRLATQIVSILTGKHKKEFSKHMDVGDYVVVINSSQIVVTGRKKEQKLYRRHSGYPGGFKEVKFSELIKRSPNRVIELAVKRMLPDNRLRAKRMNRLKVFPQSKHPFSSKINEILPTMNRRVYTPKGELLKPSIHPFDSAQAFGSEAHARRGPLEVANKIYEKKS